MHKTSLRRREYVFPKSDEIFPHGIHTEVSFVILNFREFMERAGYKATNRHHRAVFGDKIIRLYVGSEWLRYEKGRVLVKVIRGWSPDLERRQRSRSEGQTKTSDNTSEERRLPNIFSFLRSKK